MNCDENLLWNDDFILLFNKYCFHLKYINIIM